MLVSGFRGAHRWPRLGQSGRSDGRTCGIARLRHRSEDVFHGCCWNARQRRALATKAVETQGKGGVLATKAVETQGRGGVLATKAVETQGRGGALATSAVETQGRGGVVRVRRLCDLEVDDVVHALDVDATGCHIGRHLRGAVRHHPPRSEPADDAVRAGTLAQRGAGRKSDAGQSEAVHVGVVRGASPGRRARAGRIARRF